MKEKKTNKVLQFMKKHKKGIFIGIGCVGGAIATGIGVKIFTSPTCRTCGAKMTIFDGWAWHTCPKCGDSVRIIDGKEDWYNDIFKEGTKEHNSDFELADFCRGGDLTED